MKFLWNNIYRLFFFWIIFSYLLIFKEKLNLSKIFVWYIKVIRIFNIEIENFARESFKFKIFYHLLINGFSSAKNSLSEFPCGEGSLSIYVILIY